MTDLITGPREDAVMLTTADRRRRTRKPYRTRSYRTRFLEDLRDFPDATPIITEGDSWFGYPFGRDLNDQIERFGNYNIRHFEKAGEELIVHMMSERQQRLLRTALEETPFRAVLFSGGGNDIVADNLQTFVRRNVRGRKPEDYLNARNFDARVSAMRKSYRSLLRMILRIRPNCHLITHGYDYMHPSPKGFQIFGRNLTGPWVLPTLKTKGVPPVHRFGLMQILMDQFNRMLADLARRHDRFHYVDLRGTLAKGDWVNEIHPTTRGFGKVAAHFHPVLRRLFPRTTKPL
jgi:GDSL-like lipase/acylhydrolase family protein